MPPEAPGPKRRGRAKTAGAAKSRPSLLEDDPAAWNAQGEILARFRSPVAVTLTCDGRDLRNGSPLVWVTVKDATTGKTYAPRSLGCWAEAP